MKKQDGPDWARIKAEYIYTDISTRNLAKKWDVPYPTLRKRAEREAWSQLRMEKDAEVRRAAVAEAVDVVAEVKEGVVAEAVDRYKRAMELSDALAEKLRLRIDLMTGEEKPREIKDLFSAVLMLMEAQGIKPHDEDKGGYILRVEGFNSEWQE